jgi:nucleotide-binding universal stress UspA family protein
MKRILVGIDGSPASHKAARLAAEVAGRFGARLTLAYVVPRLLLPPDAYGLTVAEVEAEHRTHADEVLRQARAELGEAGAAAEVSVLQGPPAEALVEAAAATEADLVVLGSHGRGAVARVLLGSTTDRVVHLCPRPVLVVR